MIIPMATKQDKQNADFLEIKNLISDRFNQLDHKLDETKTELKQDIVRVENKLEKQITKLEGDIKTLHVEVKGIDKRLSNVESSMLKIPEITEKFGELKNWRQTAFVIIAGVVSAFLGWIARGSRL
jgi:seryl-tRNA synthetase